MFDGLGVADGTFVTDRQLPSAFGAAAGQDGAPVHGIHTRAETMRLRPFAIIRLKSTFWHVVKSARAGEPLRGAPVDTSVLGSNS